MTRNEGVVSSVEGLFALVGLAVDVLIIHEFTASSVFFDILTILLITFITKTLVIGRKRNLSVKISLVLRLIIIILQPFFPRSILLLSGQGVLKIGMGEYPLQPPPLPSKPSISHRRLLTTRFFAFFCVWVGVMGWFH